MKALLERARAHRTAFTLIELLVVIVILAILLAIAVPTYLRQQEKAHDSAVKQYLAITYRSARAEAVTRGDAPKFPAVNTLVSAIGSDQPQLAFSKASSYVYAVFPDEKVIVIDSNPSTGTLGQTFIAWGKTTSPSKHLWQVVGSSQGVTFLLLGSMSAAPSNTSAPSVSGNYQPGQTLTASPGTWTGLGDTYAYQWQTSADGSSWTNLSGQTSTTYTLQSSDLGNYIRVAVTATNASGSNVAYSPSSSQQQVAAIIPVGAVVAYAGTTPLPSGWAVADGSCGYSSGTNPDLYAAIGTTYGGTSGNFCLPDMRGKMALGKASSGTGSTLGQTGGAMDQSGSANPWGSNLALSFSWNETPPAPAAAAHSHTYTSPYVFNDNTSATGWFYFTGFATRSMTITGSSNETWTTQATALTASGTVTPSASYSVGNQPYRVVRYLISLSQNAAEPCGALWGYGGAAAPAGAGLADGTTPSACLDSAYGGTFPDLRGSFPLGQAASGSYATLNVAGGSIDQTLTGTLNTVSTQTSVNPGSWSATLVEGSHTHSFSNPSYGNMNEDASASTTPVYNSISGVTVNANSNAGATL